MKVRGPSVPAAKSAHEHYPLLERTGRVGKTSILLRYIRGEYDDKQVSTLQASYLDKKITVDNKVRRSFLPV